jgi:hypothetical protein
MRKPDEQTEGVVGIVYVICTTAASLQANYGNCGYNLVS